jgi:hemolysin TlyA family protein
MTAMKQRLDKALVERGLVSSRSQAENFIRLGEVLVNGLVVTKAGWFVNDDDKLELQIQQQLVSRAGLKLASVAEALRLDFRDKVVLDVGSSTGGFTEFALQAGARLVYAVDVGSDQMDKKLRQDPRIELHEKTDIRDFELNPQQARLDLILIDVSFISVRQILPGILMNLTKSETQLAVMLKPQFEAEKSFLNKGVIKNEKYRRQVLAEFEHWVRDVAVIVAKQDSAVSGKKGNIERFYLLKPKN